MGNENSAYQTKADEAKHPESDKSDMVWWGACGMQGWRNGMEDSHIVHELDLGGGE